MVCSSVCEEAVSMVCVSALVCERLRLHETVHLLIIRSPLTYSLSRHDQRSKSSCWEPVRSHELSFRPLIALLAKYRLRNARWNAPVNRKRAAGEY